MAEKKGYPGYPGYPPQPGASGHNVTVQHTTVHQKPAPGFFGSLKSEFNKVGKQLNKEIDYCSNKLNQVVDTHAAGAMLELFKTGNVVQLVSRASGRCLEIIALQNGQLAVDGHGPSDPQAFHTHWTVTNEGSNQVRLHNNHNYLTIHNGATCLINMPPGSNHGIETKFQLSQSGQFILLESLKERQRHIGVLPDGQLKPAVACGREDHAQFGVHVIYTPYPTSNVTVVNK
ncbi:hypothetical protein SNE40_017368 [Patella caerulea]|uniref:Uncharacterized protein n=1 Tax=Patella caerulea TaxID=87958 RepID=A0AAN8JAB8_PATCE